MTGFAIAEFLLNLAVSAAVVLALMLGTLAWAVRASKHAVVDIVWGPGFAIVAATSWLLSAGDGDPVLRTLALVLTALWGGRLGVHIARRSRGAGEDPRYTDIMARAKGNPTLHAFKVVYLTQGAVMWFVSLPVQVAMYQADPPVALLVAGTAVWLLGFAFESIGDAQLARFRADPANRGTVLDTGLWRYTRHPNYFGDACVWWGLFLLGAGHWVGLLTAVSPALMTYLLVAKTGKELLERQLNRTRPEYADYIRRTSGFVPLPPRRTAAS